MKLKFLSLSRKADLGVAKLGQQYVKNFTNTVLKLHSFANTAARLLTRAHAQHTHRLYRIISVFLTRRMYKKSNNVYTLIPMYGQHVQLSLKI